MMKLILDKLKHYTALNCNPIRISTYFCSKQQNLLNVPIVKPVLVILLNGEKKIGVQTELTCHAGDFIFFTHMQSITIRNIPANTHYFALLIEFEFSDFSHLSQTVITEKNDFTIGKANDSLYQCILQFVECLEWAPQEIVKSRRVEIINLLISLGYENLACSLNHKPISHAVIDTIKRKRSNGKITTSEICKIMGMSESTLYRKLTLEGETVQKIKENVLMGEAIHLLQTTTLSTDHIAEIIGYSSSIRFSQRFKAHFGITVKELRKTKR